MRSPLYLSSLLEQVRRSQPDSLLQILSPQSQKLYTGIMNEKIDTKERDPHAEQDDDPKANLHSLQEAQLAAAEEHTVGLKQALQENWKAAMWSAIISLTIVMEGYDLRYVSAPIPQPLPAEALKIRS